MSVRTEIDRINARVAEQAGLLAELDAAVDALPDAGSGGGGSVDTCNITFNPGAPSYNLYYTAVANGSITSMKIIERGTFGNVVLSDVVCGSMIYFYATWSAWYPGFNTDSDATFVMDTSNATSSTLSSDRWIITAPSCSGDYYITPYNDD